MNKYYLKLTSFVALFAMCVVMLPAHADGVTLSYVTPADGEIDSTEVTAGFAEVTFGWTSTNEYVTGTDVLVTLTWSDTNVTGSSTALAACTGVTTAFGEPVSYSGQTADTIVITFDDTAAVGAGNICVRVPVEDAGVLYEGNFSASVLTSNADADYGAIEYYVGGGNDVLVDASVQPTLEFAIVDQTNLALETHECHLGVLSMTDVNYCNYRLKVSTNAIDGFQVSVESDDQLGSGYATISDVGVSTAVATGTEGYGFAIFGAVDGGMGTGNYLDPITVAAPYNVNDNTVPQAPTLLVSYTAPFLGTSTLSTTLVQHKAAMDAGTPVGYYQQNVTYRITPSF